MSNTFPNIQSTIVSNYHEEHLEDEAEIQGFVRRHHEWPQDVARHIAGYQIYVNKLASKLPGSYDRLKRFLDSGSCSCRRAKEEKDVLCSCADEGGKCSCLKNESKDRSNICQGCSKPGVHDCDTTRVDDVVRIYELEPGKQNWHDFLTVSKFSVSKDEEFQKLILKLQDPRFDPEENGMNNGEHASFSHKDEQKTQHMKTVRHSIANIKKLGEHLEQIEEDVVEHTQSDEAACATMAKDDHISRHSEKGAIPSKPCRIITVSHLSPNVAKLLGSKFNISADFFNRHLPGTEAISGRLISRLPSAVQIDLDELYESYNTFEEIWGTNDPVEYGHYVIDKSIRNHFRFPVGWDYFPISKDDFEDSKTNVRLKSGYEVLLREDAEGDVKNLFQFILDHRISVYSNPPTHPRTVIIVFYPSLPIHLPAHMPKEAPRNLTDTLSRSWIIRPLGDLREATLKWAVQRFSSPKEVKKEKNELRPLHGMHACEFHGKPYLRFKSIPNHVPTPEELQVVLNDEDDDWDLRHWEESKQKQDLAYVYHTCIKWHLKDHFRARKYKTQHFHAKHDGDAFTHVFAFPLYSMVSAYWARLVIRRSFDLDLLEWRSKNRLSSTMIDEIKSRRIAIARHQRNIGTSLSTLRGLVLAERGYDPVERELAPSWNVAHANGLVPNGDDDSWQRIYGDYAELKASMDALEVRASKIHDGTMGLLNVVQKEKAESSSRAASRLSFGSAVFAIVLLPFQIIPQYYDSTNEPDNTGPALSKHNYKVYMVRGILVFIAVWAVLALLYIVFWEGLESLSDKFWYHYYRRDRSGYYKKRQLRADEKVNEAEAEAKAGGNSRLRSIIHRDRRGRGDGEV